MSGPIGRDELCRQDVSRMAELGRFGEEFTFYVCARWQEGRRRYYISERPEQIYACRRSWLLQGLYSTPIGTYSQRFMIPAGMREGIKQSARISSAQQVQSRYPQTFFTVLARYGQLAPNNTAYEPLRQIQREWNGYFDARHLQLYENLVEQAFLSKLLTTQSYWQLTQWLKGMWEQPGLQEAPTSGELRTFSAFLYETAEGIVGLEAGLPRYKVQARKEQHELAGELTTPVYTQDCWFGDITMIAAVRQQFEAQAQQVLGGSYLELVRTLRGLPSVLAGSDFGEHCVRLEAEGYSAAAQALRWYGLLWNHRTVKA